MKKVKKMAFTLVELIVTITILAILGTIGFLSFQSYNTYARDSVRLGNLKTLESALGIMYVQSSNYALPDDSVNITASGTLIRKQGVFGKKALRAVRASKEASTDPKTGEYFDYSVGANLQEYQLVTYLEGDEAGISPQPSPLGGEGAYASLSGGIMKSMGSDLGIVFSGGLEVNKISGLTNVDIINDGEFTVKFNETDEITSSGSRLFSSVYNHSKKLLKNKNLAKLDDSLVLYFDMETTTEIGGFKVLKDLSKKGLIGHCNKKGLWGTPPKTEVGCGVSGGLLIDNIGMKFDGIDNNITVAEPGIGAYNWTVELLAKIEDGNDFIIVNPNSAGLDQFIGFDNSHNRIYLRLAESGDTGERSKSLNYNIKERKDFLYHIIIQRTQEKVIFYINGQFIGEVSDTQANAAFSGEWMIGMRWVDQQPFKGYIKSFRVFDRILPKNEIKVIYASTLKN